MKSKKSMIILVLVIFIFGMASVCASDVDDSPVGLSESEKMSEITLTDEIQTIGEVDNSQITGAPDDGTFYELDNQIKTSTDNIIKLDKNYTYEESGYDEGIKIEKSDITIDGQGHTIDAKGKARIFYVQADNVVIKNITFLNGSAMSDGGAVYFSGEGNVINCKFIDNKVIGDYACGGAVWMNSGSVENCKFINNTATFVGGAVWMNSGSVENCKFINNTATNSGGAVWMYSGSVENCKFINNTATNNGGALFFSGNGDVLNCNFTNNNATGDGGALFFSGYGDVLNCNFTNNNATGDGGAVLFSGYGDVLNCNFTNNNAANNGGAVLFSGNGDVINCNFIGNNATWGSAIYFGWDDITRTISHSTFLNNKANVDAYTPLDVTLNDNYIEIIFIAQDNLINAIYSPVDVNFTNVTYWGAEGIANTDNFTPVRSNRESGQNITIEIYDSDDNLVDNVTLITDDNGQVKYDSLELKNGNYKYKIYHQEDYYYTYSEINDDFNVDLGDFNRLQAEINRVNANSVLNLSRNYNFTIDKDENLREGIVIDKAIIINGNGCVIDAKGKARIFYVQADNVVIKNITFLNGSAMSDGGAVYFSGEGNVINCKFIDNKVIGDYACGGAVWMNSGSVENCKFINNTATFVGGAVWMNSGSVENCKFINNTATNSGGAVWLYSGSVENCKFINNNAANNGGAVLFSGNGDVLNCNFIGNNATWGSAIYFGWDDITRTISHSTFLNNKANVDAYTPLDVTLNDNYIEIIFIAQDNLINAIYSPVDVNFTNVTYWGAEGIANTDNFTPVRSNRESGQNITIEIYDSDDNLVDNVTLITDDNGQVKYDSLELKNGNYKYKIYHQEDYYYTYSEINDDFNVDLGDFNRLQAEINRVNANSVLNLSRNYNFTIDKDENLREGIVIDKAIIINGNGCVIDAKEKARIFYVISSDVVLENITFINGNSSGNGGAVYFGDTGIVRNCNFTDNSASNNGGAVFFYSVGNVTNCNFIANSAYGDGGAVYFFDDGNVDDCNFYDNSADNAGAVLFVVDGIVDNCNFTDNSAFGDCGAVLIVRYGNATACNFINNTANIDGGAIAMSSGSIANCNFINNSASNSGGAVYFLNNGDVLNCNFTGNKAISASAICFFDLDASSIKSISNSLFLKNRANAYGSEPFNVTKNGNNIEITFKGQNNYLNAIYSKGDVNFTDVTYWGAEGITNTDSFTPVRSNSEAGQNITVKGVVEGNTINTIKCTDEEGKIVIEGAEDYLIIVSHEWDAYYTETVETMFTNMKFYANVTPVTTNNKTVNITAKSNIYNEIMQGKLVFILPNGTEINATCGNNGIWWAKYTFNEYGVYDVNVSYSGLLNVALSNATITISKINSTIKLDDITLSYAESRNVTVKTTGATAVTANINGINVTVVNNFTIPISGLGAGNYTLTVTTITEEDFNPVTATSKITVNKVDSTLAVDNIEFEYGSEGSGDVLFTGACMVIANVINQPKAVVNVNGKKITVSGLAVGTYTLNVTTVPDENHTAVSQTAAITVNKVNSTLMVDDVVLNYGDSINVTVTATGATGITAKINGTNVTVVNNFTIPISDLGAGNYTLTVTTIADGNHNPVTATSKITVNKINSTLTVGNIEFEYGSEGSGDVLFTGAGAVIANVINQPKAVVNVNGKKITVSGLAAGTYTLNVTTVPDENHTVVSQTAVITVNKVNSTLMVDDVVLNYGDSINVTVTATGATGITAKINGTNVTVVNNFTVPISDLGAGNYTLTVTTIADGNHNPVTATSKITVNKVDSTLTVDNIEFEYGSEGSGDVSFTGAGAVIANVINQPKAVVNVNGKKITVSGLAAATYALNVTTVPDENHTAVSQTAAITVNKVNSSLTVDDVELYYGESKNVTVTVEGASGITAKIDGNAVVVDNLTIPISGLNAGNHTLTVTTIADANHNSVTKKVSITVNKASTEIILANETIYLKAGNKISDVAKLDPGDAGNLTFVSSDEDIVLAYDGTIWARIKGNATVTVSFEGNDNYEDAKNKTIIVYITPKDTSVSVENDTLYLKVNETYEFDPAVVPNFLAVEYLSGNESVARVTEYGLLRAVGEGTTIITLTVGDDVSYAVNTTNVTVIVSKVPVEITVDTDSLDLKVGDETVISAALIPADAGNVTFTSSNDSVVEVDDEGNVIAQGKGQAIITVSFAGDNMYAASQNKTVTVNVSLDDASVTVDNDTLDLKVGETCAINATKHPDTILLDITYTSSDNSVVTVDEKGIVRAVGEGSAIITVEVGDDEMYALNSTNVTVKVSKIPTEITLTNESLDLMYNDIAGNLANLTPAGAGNLTFVSDNEDVVAVEDGYVIAVGAGKANVTVSFAGDDKYASAENKTIKVTVTAWDASVNVTKTSYELFIGESDTIVAITVPEGLKVRFESDDDEIISVDNDGKITALKKGNAIVYVSVGDNVVYKYDYAIVNVTVNKMPTEIASSSVSAVYNADKYLTVNLTDAKGNPLAGVNVNVDLNGAKNYTTDEKGQIKVSLKGLDPKTYAAGITFKGDAKYDGSAKDVKVTVKKATPMITAGAKTFKTTAKTKKYTITLKDNTGKAIKNAKVTLKVNGKTYKATTNSKGKATFKITKLNKKGSYKATVTYNGNKYYNKVTKKVSIKVISAWKTVSKGSKLKSTVKEIQRALKNNGYYLTEKGHYLMVDGIYWDYTVKAVKQFQKAKGLKATGKVDEKTAKKLKII